MSGKAAYISDLAFEGEYWGKMVRSTVSYGKIRKVTLPELPHGYTAVTQDDVPGLNLLKVVTSEQPVFAGDVVRFQGEGILMIAGPDRKICEELASKVKIDYEERKPVLAIDEAVESAAHYSFSGGKPVGEIFASADRIVKETFTTGYQEQAYLEPQGMVGLYEDGRSVVCGSMQCPYYVKNAVMQTMGLDGDHVRIVETTTGGGFGGKEDYPSLIGCQVAVAAKKTGHPVRMILGRREDLLTTPKRHPSKITYQAALDRDGNILALKADVRLDAGAYAGLSDVVLQRSLLSALGAYRIPNYEVYGAAMLTNKVSNGAFRGFGAPQSFFAIETFMNHLAAITGQDPLDYKKQYFVQQGDVTSTGGLFHHHVPIPEMLTRAEELTDYSRKYRDYSRPQTGRFHRGIGMSLVFHGCGFTGAAEQDFIKAKVKLVKNEDDTVRILVSNTDIGQGLKTTFSKIVARVLELPLERILIDNPDTDVVPDSGPTVASRSLMIVGRLLERAAAKLKKEWKDGARQEVTEHYRHPDFMIPWDGKTFHGDAYPTYSWALNVVEVETDVLTGQSRLLDVCGIFDVGTPIDRTIMIGQAQGGMLQGLGYGSSENLEDRDGRLMQTSFTDYMIPTAMDTVPFKIDFIDNRYDGGPFGAKGAGELTLVGAAPAFEAAVEQATGCRFSDIPLTPEKVLDALSGKN